jgi:hypothetical protein
MLIWSEFLFLLFEWNTYPACAEEFVTLSNEYRTGKSYLLFRYLIFQSLFEYYRNHSVYNISCRRVIHQFGGVTVTPDVLF